MNASPAGDCGRIPLASVTWWGGQGSYEIQWRKEPTCAAFCCHVGANHETGPGSPSLEGGSLRCPATMFFLQPWAPSPSSFQCPLPRSLLLLSFLFFVWRGAPSDMEFPGQGSDPSHNCDLCYSCHSTSFLNPLCRARNWTCFLALQRYRQSHYATVGTLTFGCLLCYFQSWLLYLAGKSRERPLYYFLELHRTQLSPCPKRLIFKTK